MHNFEKIKLDEHVTNVLNDILKGIKGATPALKDYSSFIKNFKMVSVDFNVGLFNDAEGKDRCRTIERSDVVFKITIGNDD